MRHEPLDGWPRRILHAVVLAGGWALFFYWWYVVAVQDWNRTTVALIIFVTLVVAPAVTVGWVMHNLALFRRKGPRLQGPPVQIAYQQDWNGRTIVADWRRLGEARHVAVAIDGDRKTYSAMEPASAEPER